MVTDKQLNGWWEILFKLNQILMPFFLTWAVWVTGNIFSMKNYIDTSPRVVAQDLSILEKDLKAWTSNSFASIVITADIKQVKSDVADLKSAMALLSYQLMNEDEKKRR